MRGKPDSRTQVQQLLIIGCSLLMDPKPTNKLSTLGEHFSRENENNKVGSTLSQVYYFASSQAKLKAIARRRAAAPCYVP